ncbi:MAG: methionyl-tRNA formyltransferase [Gammaproteobacteria bacterium]|nr:methionyl-tRNA formyltransferase [Gammaproteobacteria bacterium]
MRIVFAGTPDFAVPPLTALIESDYDLVAVYTQPDRPSGRGRKLTPSPVKQVAEQAGLPVYQPQSFKEPLVIQGLTELQPDVLVVVAYGLILPQQVIDIPKLDCINIHASLLPEWRGAAPIQRAIMNGDSETGVTIMQMEAQLDSGPVLLKHKVTIHRQTSAQLFEELAECGATALMTVLPAIHNGTVNAEVQDHSLATYAKKISKDEAVIDWSMTSKKLDCQIRGLNPWPVANTIFDNSTLKIWQAKDVTDFRTVNPGANPGLIHVDEHRRFLVETGDGMLELLEVQLPGARRLAASQFLNAHKVDGLQLGSTG